MNLDEPGRHVDTKQAEFLAGVGIKARAKVSRRSKNREQVQREKDDWTACKIAGCRTVALRTVAHRVVAHLTFARLFSTNVDSCHP